VQKRTYLVLHHDIIGYSFIYRRGLKLTKITSKQMFGRITKALNKDFVPSHYLVLCCCYIYRLVLQEKLILCKFCVTNSNINRTMGPFHIVKKSFSHSTLRHISENALKT